MKVTGAPSITHVVVQGFELSIFAAFYKLSRAVRVTFGIGQTSMVIARGVPGNREKCERENANGSSAGRRAAGGP